MLLIEHVVELFTAVQGALVFVSTPLAGRWPAHQFRCPLAKASENLCAGLRAFGHRGLFACGASYGREVCGEATPAVGVIKAFRRPGAGGQVYTGYCVW